MGFALVIFFLSLPQERFSFSLLLTGVLFLAYPPMLSFPEPVRPLLPLRPAAAIFPLNSDASLPPGDVGCSACG